MAKENVKYIISMQDKISKKLDNIDRRIGGADRKMMGFGKTIKRVGIGIAGYLSARVVLGGLKRLGNLWDEQAQAIAQVEQGIKSTGGTARRTLSQLKNQAIDLQSKTLFGDEKILKGVTSQILTFTNITEQNFDRTQKAVLDVTTRLYGADAGAESLRSTSIQLGKALNDPVANLGALSRSGIQFSKQQKEVIKDLAENNQLAKAQAIILDELEKQYGGSAEAAAKAGLGGFKQLKNELSDTGELIGKRLLPAYGKLSKFLRRINRQVRDSLTPNKKLVDHVKLQNREFNTQINILKRTNISSEARKKLINEILGTEF